MYVAYAQSGDDALYDLLGQFVGATTERYPPESLDDYVSVLAAMPPQLEWLLEDLFATFDE